MPTFEEHFSPAALDVSFERLLDGHFDVIAERPRISTGSDRIELGLFQRDKQEHLAAAARKVLSGRLPSLVNSLWKARKAKPR